MSEQYDMFGNLVPVEQAVSPKPSRKFKTMQELHGYTEGQTCKTCGFLLRNDIYNKTFYKCSLWHISSSTATDIRLKDKACGLWQRRIET